MTLEIRPLNSDEIERQEVLPDHVISYRRNGKSLSLYKHDVWNFAFQQGPKLDFGSWHKGDPDELFFEIKGQMKTLFLVLLSTPKVRLRERYKSIARYFTVLRKIAKIAHRTGCSFANARENSFFQVAFRQSVALMVSDKTSEKPANSTSFLLRQINFVNSQPDTGKVLGFDLFDSDEFVEILNLLSSKKKTDSGERTMLIPSRIYATIIESIKEELNYIEPYIEKVRDFVFRYNTDVGYFSFTNAGCLSKRKKVIQRSSQYGFELPESFPTWTEANEMSLQARDEAIKESGLSQVFEDKCSELSYLGLMEYLGELQRVCALACLVFSGMRIHELQVMPYHAIEKSKIEGFGEFTALRSHTSKLNRGEYSKQLLWVTNDIGEKAVTIAQVIAECFFVRLTSNPKILRKSEIPLWISAYTKQKGSDLVHYDYPLSRIGHSIPSMKLLSQITVDDEDIAELQTFDGLRDWNLYKGDVWPFTNHQCRRALVVYASRSGMVSLPSLGNQLKHLSLLMTALYAENSSFAKAFIEDEDHKIADEHGVVSQFRQQQIFNMSLSFHENVIATQSKLTGGTGKVIQKNKESSTLPSVMVSREATEKGIKEGRIAYTETVVGGCMRKEVCESYGIDEVLPCVFSCPDSIIGGDGGKKLKAYAEELEWGLEDLDKNSPAYQTTESELKKIKVKLLEEEGIEL